MRPNLGLLSRPWAPPQPRHSAMREVTPPVTHRTAVYSQNCGDLLGAPPLQRQQDRPRPVRLAAPISTGHATRPVPRHQPSASISPACLPPQPSSQANNPYRRPFAGGLLSRRVRDLATQRNCRACAEAQRTLIIGGRPDRYSRYSPRRLARRAQQQQERQHAERDQHHQSKIVDIGDHRSLPRHLGVEGSDPVWRR